MESDDKLEVVDFDSANFAGETNGKHNDVLHCSDDEDETSFTGTEGNCRSPRACVREKQKTKNHKNFTPYWKTQISELKQNCFYD